MPEPSTPRDAAVLVSGGLDSAVLACDLLGRYDRVHPVYVRFGLRWEAAELERLRWCLDAVSPGRPGLCPLTVLDEPVADVYGAHWSTSGPGVPDAASDAAAVYLPGRNLLLAAKAGVWCRLRGVEALAFGVLKGNPFPDSTAGFFRELEGVIERATGGRVALIRPYEGMTKVEVLRRGAELPLHRTLSCLDPVRGRHCGRCNKCEERRRAFRLAGLPDRSDYADTPPPPTVALPDLTTPPADAERAKPCTA